MPPVEIHICPACGRSFETQVRNKLFCTSKCKSRAAKVDLSIRREWIANYHYRCPICGKNFTANFLQKGCKVCSEACKKELQARQKYERKQQNAEWTERNYSATDALEVEQWHCHDCGKPSNTYRCPSCQRKWLAKSGYSKEATNEIMQQQQENVPRSDAFIDPKKVSKKEQRRRLNFTFLQGGF